MANFKKLMMSAAGGGGLDVDEVFSTYVYKGNSGSQTFVNGLDLAGEGGLVWSKRRDVAAQHVLVDSERNAGSYARILNSDNANGETIDYGYNWAFNSNGYSLNTTSAEINDSPRQYCSWSFRKAPKFFDVVTYSGNSTAGRTVSHNLGATPAWIFVKCRNSPEAWSVYYGDNTKDLRLDQAFAGAATSNWNNTSPTDTNFTLGSNSEVNGNNNTYVAYLFANNNGDGEFGPKGDQDIIKCGTFTTGGQTNEEINLGFEAQFVLIKAISGPFNWETYDITRAMGVSASTYTRGARLQPNRSDIENVSDYSVGAWENGFKFSAGINGTTYAYMAIRRGSLFPPESATEVFAAAYQNAVGTEPGWTSGFPVDMVIDSNTGGGSTDNRTISSRLTQGRYLALDQYQAEYAWDTGYAMDYMDGWRSSANNGPSDSSWMWKRAPGYFDVVAYTGNAVGPRDIPHNLGVVPEMIWNKKRTANDSWFVYHKDVPLDSSTQTGGLIFQSNGTPGGYGVFGEHAGQTATTFEIAPTNDPYGTNENNKGCIAYLFATLDGISKVGSYTGNGSSQTINCGFSAGARFILIKRIDANGNWYVWDTARGINAGTETALIFNSTLATTNDSIDPANSGFIVNQASGTDINVSSATYIFYAIA